MEKKTNNTMLSARDCHAEGLTNRLLVDRFMKQVVNGFGYRYSRGPAFTPNISTKALGRIELKRERVNLAG